MESTKQKQQAFNYKKYRRGMEDNMIKMSLHFQQHELDEQAVPSYTHNNRLMSWLFWQRIKKVIDYFEIQENIGNVLDFGCGTGVLAPYLLARTDTLFLFDQNFDAARFTINNMNLKPNILLETGLQTLQPGSIDTILALDVLEHVENLEEIVDIFDHILSPNGKIVICGPTETTLYRIGRYLAGFNNHYHARNIFDIENTIRQKFSVQVIARLFPPITLFQISVAARQFNPDR